MIKFGSLRVFAAVASVAALALVASGRARAQAPGQTEQPVDARTWIGKAAEIEAYMRTVEMLKFDELSVGVTKPKKAYLPEGGPMKYVAWKVIPPGRYGGYWEDYHNEIAAYELDKLLALNMVPPTVEKTYRGEKGAAIMWVSPSKSFKDMGVTGAPSAPPALADMWARQLVKAKMFHNLIANVDPNLGNWLVDPAWDLILIDFSRCFTRVTQMPHVLTRVDPTLWDKMKGLTEASLTQAIGKAGIGKGEIKAILDRRDRMQKTIDDLIKKNGEAYVFMRDVK